ncbi:MAG: hypothetical protein J2P45_06265 [Candidatus Dormibacteraeota bacterium]|nr:hypothetical protein [Candidatus Dormibacteraeota bacterium]
MVLFVIALIIAAGGVGAYAYYNPGAHEITVRNYHFANVQDWEPLAVISGVVLFFFLLHAIAARRRIRRIRLALDDTPPREDREAVLQRWAQRRDV